MQAAAAAATAIASYHSCGFWISVPTTCTSLLPSIAEHQSLIGTIVFHGKITWIPRGISLNSAAHCRKSLLIPRQMVNQKKMNSAIQDIQYKPTVIY